MSPQRYQLELAEVGAVEVTVDAQGTGAPVLLLHGGGGPQTVAAFAQLMAAKRDVRVIAPTHPGFGGTARPERLASIAALGALYARLLETLDVSNVTVIGNSIGGWIAAELALADSTRVRELFLVDAVGILVEGHPVADVFKLTPDELSRLSFYDPGKFKLDLASLSDAQRAVFASNRAALATYGGAMTDPTLRDRLRGISRPTTVVWGEADRVVDSDYGRSYADAIPGARHVLLSRCGHLPQIEAPESLLETVLPRA